MSVVPTTVPPGLRGFIHEMLPDMDIHNMCLTGRYGDFRRDTNEIHRAVDVQGKGRTPQERGYGTRVCSPVTGRVVQIEASWGAVWIADNYGNYVLLAHMDLFRPDGTQYVRLNQDVTIRDQVGTMDSVGLRDRSAYHLHFAVGTG
jgi:murein DD-endopeptidase MepM/ murein hydrolase activator NlpD